MSSKPLTKRFKLKVGVFLVLFQDNKVLLLRRFNTGIADGRYVLPMGGLEEGETASDAVIREANEEINLTISPIGLRVVHMMHRLHHLPNGDSFPQIDIFFLPHSYEGVIENKEPHKCDEVQFYPLDALPIETEKFIVQALQCIQNGEIYSEIGWEEKTKKEPLSSAIYETTAKTYDSYRNADPVLVDIVQRHLHWSKTGRYLDIGCGSGNYTIALSAKGMNIEGVDFSSSMLNEAKTKAPLEQWTLGDMHSLPYQASSFDGAITMNTLHYVRNGLVSLFQEMGRILKPGGKLVIFAIGLEQCLEFWLGHYFPFFRDVGYQVLAPREAIIEALEQAGFLDVQMEPFFVTEHTTDLFSYACKYRPHLFLDPKIRAGMTPLQLPEYTEDVRVGCQRLQEDITSGAIHRVISQHESDLGEGIIFSGKKE